MYKFMSSTKPSVFTASNTDGVIRVQKSNGDYAFMMESTSIEYFTERRCDLVQVGGMLDSKGYGIAVKSGQFIFFSFLLQNWIAIKSHRWIGSPYRAPLSQAILKLHETNRLLILKNRWWKEKRGGGACKVNHSVFYSFDLKKNSSNYLILCFYLASFLSEGQN